jgi:arsenate reductase (glutaredoxin)
MPELTVYHNSRCSKSREALALLQKRGIETAVIAYMQDGLTRKGVRELLDKLGIGARELLRTNEAAYRARGLADATLSETQLIDAMVAEPSLMQRPIVVKGKRAVVARPAERALELLD